jgi:hypothetical protein
MEHRIDIAGINAEQFVADLWQKIINTGFNAMSKNDFYDYVLYLFNKYDSDHFLDSASNYDNAMLLKVSETKIKSSKLNITLKHKTEEEKDGTLKSYFWQISGIKIHDKDNCFEFVLDDLSVKMAFEHELKQTLGTTFEYSINNERVKIEKTDFFQFLTAYTQKDESFFIKQLTSKLKNEQALKTLKNTSLTFIIKITKIAKEISVQIMTEIIKGIMNNVIMGIEPFQAARSHTPFLRLFLTDWQIGGGSQRRIPRCFLVRFLFQPV